jgi:hypothetical protein
MTEEDDELDGELDDELEEENEPACPFCGSQGHCEHLLLVVDQTFRTAEGGVLMNAFNKRWRALKNAGGDDFDEREPFDDLLDEVDSLSDAETDYVHEGGPGMTSAYVIYYVKSATKAQDALASFTADE